MNYFPDVENADGDGLLGISEDLNTAMLCEAYRNGIFPWPAERRYILWFAPPRRAIIPLDTFRIPDSVKRELKKKEFSFRVNHAFSEVIRACAEFRRGSGGGTWITPKMLSAYIAFNRLGQVWSFETLNGQGELVGGLYGVLINRFFAGESMFFKESGASKYALVETVKYLRERHGVEWIDSQVMNPFMRRFGARNVTRKVYMKMLRAAIDR